MWRWLEFNSKNSGGFFSFVFSGLLVIVFCRRCALWWLVFFFSTSLRTDHVLYAQISYLSLPKLAGDFLYYRNIKGKAAWYIYIVCIWQSSKICSAKPLVHFGGHRKLILPLKWHSTAQVMLNTLVSWIIRATQEVFAAHVRMLSPFLGYAIWKIMR